MEPEDRRVGDREQMERDTAGGMRQVWGILAAVAAVGAMSALLFLAVPPIWAALALVLLAFLIGGAVLAVGIQRPRRRL